MIRLIIQIMEKLVYHLITLNKTILLTSKPVFPYYQGESTIFDKGNFLFQTPDTKNFLKFKGVILNKEREGSTQTKGGLYKKLQIPNLPPKWPRSGVTFHFVCEF